MNTPNSIKAIPEAIRNKGRWAAAVGLGFLALGGQIEGTTAAAQAESAASGSQPGMVYNIGANPYQMSPEERGELIESREEKCGGVFAPEACWDFAGLSPNLWTQGLIKFTPIIPVPGSNSEAMTNDTFTRVPLEVPAAQK